MVQAFAAVAPRHPELRLVLAGKPHPAETPVLRAMVRELDLHDRVEFRSYVPYAALPDLYRGALALVYPSLWEGFGIPILEAMACGTPVITSRGSGTEEVAADAALLVDPRNSSELEDALNQIAILSQAARQQLRGFGIERASQFSWTATATNTAKALQPLID